MENTEQRVDVDGTSLRFQQGGTGSPVLFLHGAAGFQGWTPFFEKLGARHRVMAPEHPGFGLSDGQEWADSIDRLADFYVKFLSRGDHGPVHLIGSSLGGWLASEIAIRDQSLLRSLVLIAPAGFPSPDIPLPDMLSWSYEQLMRNVFANPAIAEQVLSIPLTEAQVDLRSRNSKAVARLGRNGFANPRLPELLGGLEVQTTIIWGDTDRIVPVEYAPLWKQALPEAELHVLPYCGHLPHAEKLNEVMELIWSRYSLIDQSPAS